MRIPLFMFRFARNTSAPLKISRSTPFLVTCMRTSNVMAASFSTNVSGSSQSPIDIISQNAVFDKELAANKLDFGKHLSTFSLTNTGSTVDAKTQNEYLLSGGPLANPYNFIGFHFHWENQHNPLAGSEHTLNGKAFASELHIVHQNKRKYENFADALNHPDGLSVLGVFLEFTPENGQENLEQLCNNFEKIQLKDSTSEMKAPFCPYSLLPADSESYWTYPGSLTTAPFSECVTWIVFKDPIKISQSQLSKFRMLKTTTNAEVQGHDHTKLQHICHNVRETFPVGERIIRASFV